MIFSQLRKMSCVAFVLVKTEGYRPCTRSRCGREDAVEQDHKVICKKESQPMQRLD
jgi:hypothetical protein